MIRITTCAIMLVLASTGVNYLPSFGARLLVLTLAEIAALTLTIPVIYAVARKRLEAELRAAWQATRAERATPE